MESNDDPKDDDGVTSTLKSDPQRHGSQDPLVTDEHEGRYRIKGPVGAGSQGNVYVALDTHLGRDVAVKVPASSTSASALGRFLREARIAAQLEHPNIVPVYEIVRKKDGTIYCVQRLVRAEKTKPRTLRDALREAKSLDDRLKLLNAFVEVCHGVAYAHSRGVLHRDLKPENVVLGRFGETMVLDWGLARAEAVPDPAESGSVRMPTDSLATMAGMAYGTPAYMSPEQARGETDIDARTDLWSLGAMLYELLTGRLPFLGESAMETVQQVLTARVPIARETLADVPPELSAIVARALQRDPASRYDSAHALAEDVIAWQNGHRVQVYRYGAFELLKLFLSRNRLATVIGLASLVAVFVAAGFAVQKYREARLALSSALLEKARDAERALQWDKAASLYAQALEQNESDETRWGVRLTARRQPPPLERLTGQPGPAHALAFSPDGKMLAVGAGDGTVYLWEPVKKTRLGAVKVHQRDVTGLSFSADGKWLATSSQDGSVRVLAVEGWHEEPALVEGIKDPFNAVAFSTTGNAVAWAGEDGHVRVVSWPGREVLYDAALPSGKAPPAYALAFAPDGRTLAWCNWAGEVVLVALEGPEPRERRLIGHFGAVLALTFAPDGRELVSAGRDGSVRLWNVATGKVEHSFEGHSQKVYAAQLSPDGRQLATGGTDRTVRLWDRALHQPNIGASLNDGEDIFALAWSNDGRTLAWAGTSGDVRLRAVPPRSGFGGTLSRVQVLEVSPDRRWLLSAQTNGFELWDVASGTRGAMLKSEGGAAADAVFMSGDRVAWTCGRGSVCVAARDGTGVQRRFEMPEGAFSIEVAKDGAWLVVGGQNGLMRWFDVQTGAVLHETRVHTSVVFDFALSPDGKTLASASYDKTVRLWAAAEARELRTLSGHTHGVRRAAFSPDGHTLATTAWDTTVRLWDVERGAQLAVGARHEDHVFALSWAPSGQWLATGARDGTIRIWDAKTARELARTVADVGEVFSLVVDPDESGLWYGGLDVHRLDFQR